MFRRLTVALLISAAIWPACDKKPAQNLAPQPSVQNIQPRPIEAPRPVAPPPTSIRGRVFVDTSGSMAGFFAATKNGRDSRHLIMAVHEELDGAFAAAHLGTARKCTIGENLRCDGAPSSPKELGQPGHYVEASSRLDLVLKRQPLPERIDPNHPPARDLLDEADLTVLLTDGMESSTPSGGPGADSPCAHGSDPTCVASLLRTRASEGFGTWLVGVLLPFNGRHYPERTLTDAYLDRARKHVDELRFDPRNLGVTFAIKGGVAQDKRSGAASYAYEGYKPLLMMVFSRNVGLGRSFVSLLLDRLRAAPIHPGKMASTDTVQTVELAPLSTGLRATKVSMPAASEQENIPPSALAEFRLEGSAKVEDMVSSKVWCGGNGRGLLAVEFEEPDIAALPAFVKRRPDLVPTVSFPPGAIAPTVEIGANRLRTGINCALFPKGHTEVRLSLKTRNTFDQAEVGQQWWSTAQWSGDNAWETPEKLQGLEALVRSVLRLSEESPAVRGDIRVHVQRS